MTWESVVFASVVVVYACATAYRMGRSRGFSDGFERHKEILAWVWDPGRGDYFEARRVRDEAFRKARSADTSGTEGEGA